MPTTALLVLAVARAAGVFRKKDWLPPWALRCALGALLLGNIQALPAHIDIIRPLDTATVDILDGLRALKDRERPQRWEPRPEVLKNPLYIFFRTGVNPYDPE